MTTRLEEIRERQFNASNGATSEWMSWAPQDIAYLLSEVDRLQEEKEMLLQAVKAIDALKFKFDHDFRDVASALKTCHDAGLLKEE